MAGDQLVGRQDASRETKEGESLLTPLTGGTIQAGEGSRVLQGMVVVGWD